MLRTLASALTLLTVLASACSAQTGPKTKTLQELSQELAALPASNDPMWLAQSGEIVRDASLAEIKEALPSLVRLSESEDGPQSRNALFVIYGIASRQKAGLPENQRENDIAAAQLVVPYIPRLAPRLFDPDMLRRSVSLMTFQSLAAVRPAPPELIAAAIQVLQDPRSTIQLPDAATRSPARKAPSMGPLMLWVLLPAGATFYRDPVTGITERQDSPDVQQAILTFLRRPDQTAESRTESIRAMALAQPQNTAVNAELLRWLDSSDTSVQVSLLRNLPRLTLSPADFAWGNARVKQLSEDPAAPNDVRMLATALLGCWNNDRHRNPECMLLHP